MTKHNTKHLKLKTKLIKKGLFKKIKIKHISKLQLKIKINMENIKIKNICLTPAAKHVW